jgi:hypothetical protein
LDAIAVFQGKAARFARLAEEATTPALQMRLRQRAVAFRHVAGALASARRRAALSGSVSPEQRCGYVAEEADEEQREL